MFGWLRKSYELNGSRLRLWINGEWMNWVQIANLFLRCNAELLLVEEEVGYCDLCIITETSICDFFFGEIKINEESWNRIRIEKLGKGNKNAIKGLRLLRWSADHCATLANLKIVPARPRIASHMNSNSIRVLVLSLNPKQRMNREELMIRRMDRKWGSSCLSLNTNGKEE